MLSKDIKAVAYCFEIGVFTREGCDAWRNIKTELLKRRKTVRRKPPVQQLKAEVASLVPKLESINTVSGWSELNLVINRLRQLSAV